MTRPIDRARWLELEPLLDHVLDLSPEQRPDFLDRLGHRDADLRIDLERLLDGAQSEGLDQARNSVEGFLHEAAAATPPTRIGRYQVLGLMGKGGMGDVYVARDPTLERTVALKLLPLWLDHAESPTRALLDEGRIASGVDHPNVATVHDAGWTEDGRAYLAMAHYEGRTLEERLSEGPIPIDVATGWAIQAARGLAAVHAKGIVHRDIKPANLIVTDGGDIKIIDFGIAFTAEIASSPPAAGTLRYQSPEQAAGDLVDARSDVFSLGIVLSELFGAKAPTADGPTSLPDDTPQSLAGVVQRCVAVYPASRPADAAEVLRLLERAERRPRVAWKPRPLVWAAGIAAAAVGGWGLSTAVPDRTTPTVDRIAVFPLAPVESDSLLLSLGRRLAVTIGTSINSVGDLSVVEPTSVLAQPIRHDATPEDHRRTALALGASVFVSGTVLPSADEVRLELVVRSTETNSVMSTGSVQGAANDLAGLTDSATLHLLPTLLAAEGTTVPSVAALRTRSVEALEAYVDGEQAFADADWPAAVAAFERSIAYDSTLWIAHLRSIYPRVYERGDGRGARRWRAAVEHRTELPGPDRGLIEVGLTLTLGSRIRAAESLTERYPTYWPAWFELGNTLVHQGPHVGRRLEDAKVPLERAVALNPNFLAAREHLVWVDLAAGRWDAALDQLQELRQRRPPHVAQTPYLPLLTEVVSRDLVVTSEAVALASDMFATTPRPEALATTLSGFGLFASQVSLADSLLARDPPIEVAAALALGRGFAWATRGDWIRADESIRHAVTLSNDPTYRVLAAGLFVSGAVAGAVELDLARDWLSSAKRSNPSPSLDHAAELAWMDGVVAWANGDEAGLRNAIDRATSTGAESTPSLAEALRILVVSLTDTGTAAGLLADFELREAERGAFHRHGYTHPWFTSVNRTLAAQWALSHDRPLVATQLLAWDESVLWDLHGPMGPANKVFSPVAARLRALVAASLGRDAEARRELETFLHIYDHATGTPSEWVDEARRAIRTES